MTTPAQLAAEVNKVLGKDVLMMGNNSAFEMRYLPTGVLPFDVLTGGGFPRNRITELYGDWSTMKSYVCLMAAANTLAAGGSVALIDTEHSYDSHWAAEMGVDTEALMVMHPATGEEAVDASEALIRGGVDLLIWDSVAATLPKDEAQKASEDSFQPGRLATLMSRSLRKLTTANSNTAMVYTNQVRMNIGVRFGNPETTPGGKSLPFFASMRVNMRRTSKVTEDVSVAGKTAKLTVGMGIRASLEKSKVNRPHRDTEFIYDYRIPGVDEVDWLTRKGMEHGLVVKTGHKYSSPLDSTGKECTYEKRWHTYLSENTKLMQLLVDAVLEIES
ncbi:RecA RecA/RadA recombinase [uncultured Caudovirales phage]|uniref:RecA RecA/RadA recombinase n=1 Tax=uncultured Caudovirales phage TaxID=2100421 RepID=A0A6J7WRD7_9CAUD|nr:RecA RecA/RadA recombinase [uncultured Caudovirales phage]